VYSLFESFSAGFCVCCTSLLLYNVTPEWLASADDGSPEAKTPAGSAVPHADDATAR
jgi:hypothetical protein